MRKLTASRLVLLLAALATAPVSAQAPGHRAGILAGANFATVSGSEVDNVSSLTTLFGGLFGEFALSRRFAIEPELLYSRKGFSDTQEGIDVSLKLDYFEVPVLLKVVFPGNSTGEWALRPHLYVGPAVAFKMSCKATGEVAGTSTDVDCDQFAEFGTFNGTDFSAIVGGGVDIGRVMLGARYDYGLSNIASATGFGSLDAKNRVFSIYAGFGFRLGK